MTNAPILEEAKELTTDDKERLLAVLRYWHKLEFFIPFDLSGLVDDAKDWEVRWLYESALRQAADAPEHLWQANIPDEYEITGFNLYLNIFDKSEIVQICAQNLQAEANGAPEYEEDERTELEGLTCFAKLKFTAQGGPRFEQVSISTLPWALGQTQKHGLKALTHEAFEHSKNRLTELLQNFLANRSVPADHEESSTRPLTGIEIIALHEIFCVWAEYSSQSNQAVALLKVCTQKKASPVMGGLTSAEIPSAPLKFNAAPQTEADANDTDTALEDEDDEIFEFEIDILNSFFIQDIERAITWVKTRPIPTPLKQYLTAIPARERLDLYSEAGRQLIFERLHPKYLNLGHWLDDAEKGMNLMQQFAVNTALSTLHKTGLFSVNGPPGTGKTTLLRDLFSDNIVRRAQVLASFKQAHHAFDGNIQVQFPAEPEPISILTLNPKLTGFEMVVASSNNAAVENISRDLPKRKQLGKAWRTTQYLQPIAHKVAAQKDSDSFDALSEQDMPWGLISCALGNSTNRWKFKERFAFLKKDPHKKASWAGLEPPENIFDWLKKDYAGLSFSEAAEAFKKAEQATLSKIAERIKYAELLNEVTDSAKKLFFAGEENELHKAKAFYQQIKLHINQVKAQLLTLTQQLTELERWVHANWWKKLTSFFKRLTIKREISSLKKQHVSLQLELELTLDTYKKAQEALERKAALWAQKIAQFEELNHKFSYLKLPKSLDELDTEFFQKNGLWHDQELAHCRSTLFSAALTLHEAWLAEVAKCRWPNFKENIRAITRLLSNRQPDKEEHILPIWQSLFMIVPVVSTTFASFANQFRGLGPNSLGWLFIDEAGQAVPQAAVGALWRAQRAVVVGDPQQIEPVYTLPSKLVTALAELSEHTCKGTYAPNKVSVQQLADHANPYGATITMEGNPPVWIGSPLRVHWRCIDPMFSLSNQIAYEGKMIFGLKERSLPDAAPIHCPSAWIDIKGPVNRKQDVREQIQFVIEILMQLYLRDRKWPALYIISPFKAIKDELRRCALHAASRHPLKIRGCEKWCRANIGTIHTFQGKEADTVIMVLGVDHQHRGAAQWASSKPNLLNVALTRAQRRFYIVGDKELWREMPYFREAISKLPATTADQFLHQAGLSTLTMPA
ncbi:Uncharacterized protein MCB1EB_1695 [Mycoavidus cysteinexigens]|uniref:Uncharacterized protein n=1 Tax=Mycoavidus cysteinexigens TaxID=1553431 RepID=A0A2Z6EWR4_9BURK|nr:ATP-binding protein [Mycoavidus cysteinexigens]BBE09856.1 Uncharacterized protein MCB1EB_1695 [Mycoavidus cysteinexigens]GAM53795.1 superfamily I DNA/RNA helicase protein [bacterium endosymbiont of Mortierella elongata FMR23-6]GLR02304.1 ATP-binding protein [Mycoavidus cysteinexigens]